MGAKGSGAQTQTATTQSGPPADVLQNYYDVTQLAKNVAQKPYQQYTGPTLAGFTPDQNKAFQNINNAQGAYQPYFDSAQTSISGAQSFNPTQFSAGEIQKYQNPYTQNVIDSTLANVNQEDAKQQNSLQGNAIAHGAWGGDRADLARNDLARQQDLAKGQIIAGLNNQNYSQALGQFNQANQTGMQAAGLNNQTALSGAGLYGALGNYAQNNSLNSANALYNAGTAEQQLVQNQLNIPYQQFQQQQQYPFNTTSWLSNILQGIGSNSGGTKTETTPNGNSISSGIGTGLGLSSLLGGSIGGSSSGGSNSNILWNTPGQNVADNSGILWANPGQNISGFAHGGSIEPEKYGLGGLIGSVGGFVLGNMIAPGIGGQIGASLGGGLGGSIDGGGGSGGGSAGGPAAFVPDKTHPLTIPGSIVQGNPGVGMHEVQGFNPIVAGTPVYGLNSPAQPITPPVAQAAAPSAPSNSDLTDFNKFSNYFNSNTDFANQFPIVWHPTHTSSGYGASRDALGDAFKAFSMNPTGFKTSFERGGEVKGYAMAGSVIGNSLNMDDPLSEFHRALALRQGELGVSQAQRPDLMNLVSLNPHIAALSGPQSMMNGQSFPTTIDALSGPQSFGSPSGPQSIAPGSDVQQSFPVTPNGPQSFGSNAAPSLDNSSSDPKNMNSLDSLKQELSAISPTVDKNLALANAGFSIAAGKSPDAMQNIAGGALEGLKNYAEQKKNVQEFKLKEAEAVQRAQQLAVEAERYNKQLQIEQENADTNKGFKNVMAKTAQQKADTYQKMNDPGAMGSQDPEMQGLFGEDFISALAEKKGDEYANKIKSMALTGNLPSASAKSPLAQQELADIYQFAPNSSSAIKTAITRFDSGKQGDQIRFLSNTYTHLDTLESLGNALQNNDTKALNALQNKFKDQFGKPVPVEFNAAKQIVGNELVKAIISSGGALGDRDEAQGSIDRANSPAQLNGVIQTYKALLGGQMKGMYNQFKSSTKQDDDKFLEKLDTPAKRDFTKLVTEGQQPSIVDSAKYHDGQTATGPNGEKIMFSNGKWIKK